MDFRWILEGFWMTFGIIFRTLYPMGFQVRFKIDFGRFWPPNWRSQRGSTSGLLQFLGQLFVSWGCLGAKMPPGTLQDPSKSPLGIDFRGFWPQLGGFWVPTCMILLLPLRPRARGRLPKALRYVYVYIDIKMYSNKF